MAENRIREAGFNHLKLTQLASELGVSHAALYKHVASKGALLDLISEKWLLKIDECLERVSPYKWKNFSCNRGNQRNRVCHRKKTRKKRV